MTQQQLVFYTQDGTFFCTGKELEFLRGIDPVIMMKEDEAMVEVTVE